MFGKDFLKGEIFLKVTEEDGSFKDHHVKNAVLLQIYYLNHQKLKDAATSVVENLYSGQMTRMKLYLTD